MEFLPPAELPDDEYPFILNTGRQMYHWHTGTMTRRSFGLDARESDAHGRAQPGGRRRAGVQDGDPIAISSRRGRITIAARSRIAWRGTRCSCQCTIVRRRRTCSRIPRSTRTQAFRSSRCALCKLTPVVDHTRGSVPCTARTHGSGIADRSRTGHRCVQRARVRDRSRARVRGRERRASSRVASPSSTRPHPRFSKPRAHACCPSSADVSKEGEADRSRATAEESLGPIDILVANAGGPPSTLFESTSDEQYVAAFSSTC